MTAGVFHENHPVGAYVMMIALGWLGGGGRLRHVPVMSQ